jgi:hypothetical protein
MGSAFSTSAILVRCSILLFCCLPRNFLLFYSGWLHLLTATDLRKLSAATKYINMPRIKPQYKKFFFLTNATTCSYELHGFPYSVADFWGWDAHEARLSCPDEVSGDMYMKVRYQDGPLSLSLLTTQTMVTMGIFPTRKNSHGRAGNRTRDHIHGYDSDDIIGKRRRRLKLNNLIPYDLLLRL